MSEKREELLKELCEELAKPVDEILDLEIKKKGLGPEYCLDPARRAALATRLATDIDYMQKAIAADGTVLVNMCAGRLRQTCLDDYKLPMGGRSGEIDSLSAWLQNIASILDAILDE